MQPTTLILLSLIVPAIATAANMALSDNDNWRDGATLVASLITFFNRVVRSISDVRSETMSRNSTSCLRSVFMRSTNWALCSATVAWVVMASSNARSSLV